MIVAGHVYRPGEGAAAGWLEVEDGRIVREGDGPPPRAPDAEGLVLPRPVDAHTHVGDFVGRGTDITGMTLAQVVAPPDGLKHRLLRDTPPERLLAGMRAAVAELRAGGCRAFVDFREGGVEGARMLREALAGSGVRGVILGRPRAGWDDDEARAVLEVADGIGLSGLGDVLGDVPERAARAARAAGKRLALHLSEGRREDCGRALDLRPQLLVHLVRATDDDLAAVAAARVPIAVCPRSNALFGPPAPVPAMLAHGIEVALGSDNAMFHPLGVLLDARLAQRQHGLAREAALDLALVAGRRVVDGRAPRSWLHEGDEADLCVLAPQGPDPLDAVFGPVSPRAVLA